MTVNAKAECRRNCWWAAAAGGVLITALLALLAHYHIITALFFGLMFLALFGGFLIWAFCSGEDTGPARPQAAAMPALAASAWPAPTADAARPAAKSAAPAAPAPTVVVPSAAAVPAATLRAAPVAAEAAAPAARAAEPKPAAKAAKAEPAAKAAKAEPAAKAAKAEPARAAKGKSTAKAEEPKATAKAPRKTGSGLDAALARSKDGTDTGTTEILAAPRGGVADDLKMIKGVGPALEKLLNGIGVWHFDQIAAWKARDIAFVDSKMGRFKGRVTRDEWIGQARTLARGGQTEFSTRVAKGEVY